MGATGTQTAAITATGDTNDPFPNRVANVESWDGTSWTEVADVNTIRSGLAGAGIQTDAIIFGGQTPTPGVTGNTESWNGTAWTEVNNLATARSALGGDGTSSLALAFGGQAGWPGLTATEEWTTASSFQQENLGQVFYNSTADAFKVTKDNQCH
jgi:hypothetical protein